MCTDEIIQIGLVLDGGNESLTLTQFHKFVHQNQILMSLSDRSRWAGSNDIFIDSKLIHFDLKSSFY